LYSSASGAEPEFEERVELRWKAKTNVEGRSRELGDKGVDWVQVFFWLWFVRGRSMVDGLVGV
jgi:hypothetical protein